MPIEPVTADAPIAWSAIVVAGPEAEAFLQGQLTQDVAGLASPRWTLVLEPDSAVVAPARLERRDDAFALVLEAALAEAARARLARFRLRVRCEIDVEDGAAGPFATVEERLDARWPGAPEMGRGLTPHGLGRRVVDAAVSFTKGCFTGQELVGRLDVRGARVPWRLVAASAPSLEAVQSVLASAGPAGPQGVTTAVASPGGVRALGVAHRTLAAGAHGEVVVEEVDGP